MCIRDRLRENNRRGKGRKERILMLKRMEVHDIYTYETLNTVGKRGRRMRRNVNIMEAMNFLRYSVHIYGIITVK
jgi:hypothetical protein